MRWSGLLLVLTLLAMAVLASPAVVAAPHDEAVWARVSYYLPTGYPMADGTPFQEGLIGCGSAFPTGTVLYFVADGSVKTCHDTGYSLPYWIDIAANTDTDGWNLVGYYTMAIVDGQQYTQVIVLSMEGGN